MLCFCYTLWRVALVGRLRVGGLGLSTPGRIRLEILDILRLRHQDPERGLADLNSLAKAFGQPSEVIRSACDTLECRGYVEKVKDSDDANPSYSISPRGLAYLRVLGANLIYTLICIFTVASPIL